MSKASSDVREESRASGGPAECHIPHPLLTSCLPLAYPYSPLAHLLLTSCLPLAYLCHSRKFTSVIPDIGNRESTLANLLFFLDTR